MRTMKGMSGLVFSLLLMSASAWASFPLTEMNSSSGEGFFSPGQQQTEQKVGQGRAVTIERGGSKATIHYDALNRPQSIDSPVGRTVFLYANPTDMRPSQMAKNGLVYSITYQTDKIVRLKRVVGRKNWEEWPTEVQNYTEGFYSWLGSCGALCLEGSDGTASGSMQSFINNLASWVQVGGGIGAAYGWAITALEGGAATAAFAEAIALYGAYGVMAAVVFYGAYNIGTVVYDQYGDAFWIDDPSGP